MRIHRDERGQTIILVAFSLPLLLGFVGIATDVGALFKDKRTMQTAADSAAIAAALNLSNGTWSNAGKAASAANGYTDGTDGVIVSMNNPPTWSGSNYRSPGGSPNGYVEATITKPESTIFLALFGHPSVTVLARAVATNSAPGAGCVFTGIGTTPPTGPALTVTGSMQAPQCGLVVDSTSSPPMLVAGTLNMKSIGTVGDCADSCGAGSLRPTPVSGIIPYSDPLSYLPQVTCTSSSCTLGSSVLSCVPDPNLNGSASGPLFAGCYQGLTINGANVTLNPGTYVINGNLTLTGSNVISGTGVTLYVNNGTLTINSPALNISAPTSGIFNGVLFAQSSLDANTAMIIGNPNSNTQGFFYFPDNTLQLNGNFSNLYTGFVAQSITVTGNLSFNNYSSLPGVTSPITSAVLVE